jgi:hypothetical protein
VGLQADHLGGPLHAHVQSMGTALEDVLGDALKNTEEVGKPSGERRPVDVYTGEMGHRNGTARSQEFIDDAALIEQLHRPWMHGRSPGRN